MLDSSQKQVIFFTDESDYQNEAPYYDAIIELKKEFPDEMKKMKVITAAKAKKYYSTFELKGCPAILVLHQNRITAKVNGDASKDKIIEPLSKALMTGT
ncbi:small peptidoglycan-associated lipoprotein [Bacillus infantis]|nr:small peptidoglycan-associated lipoprotein [Bacillus infantis]OXT16594.1 small peptidoglycan-associated lipoprotein [Bacillus sp. OG2]